jgi:hypothetical protein
MAHGKGTRDSGKTGAKLKSELGAKGKILTVDKKTKRDTNKRV